MNVVITAVLQYWLCMCFTLDFNPHTLLVVPYLLKTCENPNEILHTMHMRMPVLTAALLHICLRHLIRRFSSKKEWKEAERKGWK